MADYSSPKRDLLERQAEWLAPARAGLLRRAQIARRKKVLDLACGAGTVTDELARRCGGRVVAIDRKLNSLTSNAENSSRTTVLCADARQLPLPNASFDLVFCQFAMLWLDAPKTAREIARVLEPGGMLAAIEPDYGGMIEHPPEIATRDIWLAALQRAGADPCIGRKLPEILAAAGFQVRVDLLDSLMPPSPLRFDLLHDLPLTDDELSATESVKLAEARLGVRLPIVHLPMFLIMAEKSE